MTVGMQCGDVTRRERGYSISIHCCFAHREGTQESRLQDLQASLRPASMPRKSRAFFPLHVGPGVSRIERNAISDSCSLFTLMET